MEYSFLNISNKKDVNTLSFLKNEEVFSINNKIGLKIKNSGSLNIFNIIGNLLQSMFIKNIKDILSLELSTNVGHFKKNKISILLKIGPDELLLINNKDNFNLMKTLKEKMNKIHFGLTELSDHYQALYLSGEKTRWVLSKGCPINLDENIFLPGHCAQTLLGNSNIILFCTKKNEFTLICVSSYANYILSWLKESSLEHGYKYNN